MFDTPQRILTMNIKIFAIGGNWTFRNLIGSGDCFVGTAHDAFTALSLLDLIEKNGGYAVSLHGSNGPDTFSGEFLLNEARNIFNKITEQVDRQILDDAGLEKVS